MYPNQWQGWEAQLLAALGVPQTPQNLQFLQLWGNAEGSYWTTNNPLNVLSDSYGGYYPSQAQGITGTAAFMQPYTNVMAALQSGNPFAPQYRNGIISDLNTWGTHTVANWLPTSGSAGSSSSSSASSSAPSSVTSASSPASGNAPQWLQNIGTMPFFGSGIEGLVASGIVGSAAFVLLLIGGAWLILSNTTAKTTIENTTKTAAKAAAA